MCTLNDMSELLSHILVWAAFFIGGIIFGYCLTFILMQASKLRY
jgi:hypothetical protein